MASLTALGALSTSVLASVRPRPVFARSSLITWIFLPPSPVRMTSNSGCSSAASAAAPPPAWAAKRNGARRAIAWMDKQLPVIQQDVLYAERRIAEFRSQHPLLATKSGSLTEAQLYGVNTALVQARAALGGKRAKLDIIRPIQSTGGDLATMTAVLESPLLSAPRSPEERRVGEECINTCR